MHTYCKCIRTHHNNIIAAKISVCLFVIQILQSPSHCSPRIDPARILSTWWRYVLLYLGGMPDNESASHRSSWESLGQDVTGRTHFSPVQFPLHFLLWVLSHRKRKSEEMKERNGKRNQKVSTAWITAYSEHTIPLLHPPLPPAPPPPTIHSLNLPSLFPVYPNPPPCFIQVTQYRQDNTTLLEHQSMPVMTYILINPFHSQAQNVHSPNLLKRNVSVM